MRSSLPLLVALLASGCYPDVGECDMTAAHEIVYDSSGLPAYAGQAIMMVSCGYGGHCHSGPDIEAGERFGAPVGLSFDVRIAATTIDRADDEEGRLSDAHTTVVQNTGLIWQQVSSGAMPPGGEAWREYTGGGESGNALPTYQRVEDDGVTFHDLPRLRADDEPLGANEAADAREILRNWLACGAPVIARTQYVNGIPPSSTDQQVGQVVPLCERNCVHPSWQPIYKQIITPSCARSRCHDDSDPAEGLDFASPMFDPRDDPDRGSLPLPERLIGDDAEGSQCRPERHVIVTAGDPSASLLYLKVSAPSSDDVCGSRMPLAGNPLTDQRLCAIREWIRCGAVSCDPDDAACITARDECLSTLEDGTHTDAPCGAVGTPGANGLSQCVEPALCQNHPTDTEMD